MPGDNETEVIEQQPQTEAPVLSKEKETPKPEGDPKAGEKQNAYHRRQEARKWKEKLQAMERSIVSDDDVTACMELAKAEGMDTSDEGSKKQIMFLAKASGMIAQKRSEKLVAERKKLMSQASSNNLGLTLEQLGYTPGSEQYQRAGNLVIRELGVEDPDVFLDENKVKGTIESAVSSLIPTAKKGNSVMSEIQGKAGLPKPAAEPKGGSAPSDREKIKQFAAQRGISVEKAAKIMELQSKLPKQHQFKH